MQSLVFLDISWLKPYSSMDAAETQGENGFLRAETLAACVFAFTTCMEQRPWLFTTDCADLASLMGLLEAFLYILGENFVSLMRDPMGPQLLGCSFIRAHSSTCT